MAKFTEGRIEAGVELSSTFNMEAPGLAMGGPDMAIGMTPVPGIPGGCRPTGATSPFSTRPC